MEQSLLGAETEYALAARGADGRRLDSGPLLAGLMMFAGNHLVHLKDENSEGIFLTNGGLIYVDCESHPEFATPECTDPKDAVRYILAGEHILQGLADGYAAQTPDVAEVLVWKSNVDYFNPTASWGCHESYLYKGDLTDAAEQMLPFLVSRIIFTGAGGFDPKSRQLRFSLSPRVSHLRTSISASSTERRGIFHVKNEPLCGHGYGRIHLICGESLSSETSMFLKTGTSALVVMMIQQGLRPGDDVRLNSPLQAMRTLAKDAYCCRTVPTTCGRRLQAVEIQRHYLHQAEAQLDRGCLPDWAPEVIHCWRQILDRIEEGGAEAVSGTLDWAIKWKLYSDRLRRRSVGSSRSMGFAALRAELCEIDTRFAQLGERGIFATLDRAGVLDHHVPGIDCIAGAVSTPPSTTRAWLRGEWVRRLADRSDFCVCSWDKVCDYGNNRVLGLEHPFENQECWQDWPSPGAERAPSDILARRARAMRSTTLERLRTSAGRQSVADRRSSEVRALAERLRAQGRHGGSVAARQGSAAPSDGRLTADGFGQGDRVVLRRPPNSQALPREEWVSQMDACDGAVGSIQRIVSQDDPGRSLVIITCRGRQWTTRTCHLSPAGT